MKALGAPLFTEWIPASRRRRLHNADIALKDQDGRDRTLADLLDQPALITFFYSRCQNAEKCSIAMSQLALLQRQLKQIGIEKRVRLIAITYEPQFDTPERMNRFATDRGLRLGEHALTIQLDGKRHQQFVDEMLAPVNYNSGWVNTHGVELSLVDARGQLVRKYTTLLWRNEQVVKDLKRVMAEP